MSRIGFIQAGTLLLFLLQEGLQKIVNQLQWEMTRQVRMEVFPMNEKFLALPQEKRMRIINAGLEYFGRYGYKNANTEDIAAKAGISKGLLFYYFKNKEDFYLYLCRFCKELMDSLIEPEEFNKITDFFDLIDYGSRTKLQITIDYPFIEDFSLNLFFSGENGAGSQAGEYVSSLVEDSFDMYFRNIDLSPFKDGINPKKIYQMLVWLSEGYLREKQRSRTPLSFEEVLTEFNQWKVMFKNMCYKEEYL